MQKNAPQRGCISAYISKERIQNVYFEKNMFVKLLTEQTFCAILYPNRGFENVYAKLL